MLPIRDQHPHVKGFAAESHGTLAGHPAVEDNFSYQASSTQVRTGISRERRYAALSRWMRGNTIISFHSCQISSPSNTGLSFLRTDWLTSPC